MPTFLLSKYIAGLRLSIVAVAAAAGLFAGAAGCANGVNGRDVVERFDPLSREEEQAVDVMRAYIATSEALLERRDLSARQRDTLEAAIWASRRALDRFIARREQGSHRQATLGFISAAALRILTDDVTGFGVANDVWLVPLGVAAIATHIFSDSPATQDRLLKTWHEVGQSLDTLGDVVEKVVKSVGLAPLPSDPEARRKRCRPRKICPHRGNDPIHNACADGAPPNRYPGCDVFVNGFHFDALDRSGKVLWEVKTDNWSGYSDWLRQKSLDAHAKTAQREYEIAKACNFGFVFAVVDKGLYRRLRERLGDIKVRHVPQCGKKP